MNRFFLVLLIFTGITVGFETSGSVELPAAPPELSQIPIDLMMKNAYKSFRQGGHHKLRNFLKQYPEYQLEVVSDSLLDTLLKMPGISRNEFDFFQLNLLQYGHKRKSNPPLACAAIRAAASTVSHKLKDPDLSLELYELALLSRCEGAKATADSLAHFVKHDYAISLLLDVSWPSETDDIKKQHMAKLKQSIIDFPESRLVGKAMEEIASIYYWLRDYGAARSWGYRAMEADPSLVEWEPLQQQLIISDNHIYKKRTLMLFKVGYMLCGLLLVYRMFRSRQGFDVGGTLKKLAWILPVFAVLSALLFWWDSRASIPTALGLTTFTVTPKQSIFPPLVPLSIMDYSFFPFGFIVVGLGLLPIFYAVIYTGVKKDYSRIILFGVLIWLMGTSWSHFFLVKGWDKEMVPAIVFKDGRVYLNDELDSLMLNHPEVLDEKIRKYIEPSQNLELFQFFRDHLPNEFATYKFPEKLYSSDVLLEINRVDSAYRNYTTPLEHLAPTYRDSQLTPSSGH